jgi:soluble lytic murein transglycosylase-like protein
MRPASVCKGALGLLLVACASLAQADMWIYKDARGVTHMASSQLDARYQRMFKSVPPPEPREVAESATALTVPHNPIASAKIVSKFDNNPKFLAVKDHMRSAAEAHQVDFALLQAVIAAESGFDPQAISPKGAVGLMQLMPATAQRYGVTSDRTGTVVTKLTDPKTNINAGTRYLKDLIAMFPGQPELAVAAYNAGEGAVQKAGNKVPNYKETQNYVRTVMQLYNRLNPQASRG